MAKKKSTTGSAGTLKKNTDINEKKHTSEAHDQADTDIEADPDLNTEPHREDDLDEGELARLEGED